MQSRNDMLKTSVLRRAIVVHQLNHFERDSRRAQTQAIADRERRASDDFLVVDERTVRTVIFDDDGAMTARQRAMSSRDAWQSTWQRQRAAATVDRQTNGQRLIGDAPRATSKQNVRRPQLRRRGFGTRRSRFGSLPARH